MNMPKVLALLKIAASLLLILPHAPVIDASSSKSDFGGSNAATTAANDLKQSSTTKWSSLLTVDPTKILSILIKHGGLLIPKEAEKDISVLRSVMAVDKSQLNVVERELILHNFSVALPNQKEALKIGRVSIRWDSYSEPCLDIEVDSVDVLMEFTNLMLSRSNWGELRDFGFPPAIPPSVLGSHTEDSLSFVRFNRIDLSKNLTVQVLSRPLKKKIGGFSLDMEITDELNERIRKKSDDNLGSTGRRGCTVDDLATLIQEYLGQSVRNFVSNRLQDLATKPVTSLLEVDRVLAQTSESILSYAGEALEKSGEDVEEALAVKMAGWGLDAPRERLRVLKELSIDAVSRFNASALKERLSQTQTVMENMASKVEEAFRDDGEKMSDDIMFADW